MNTPVLLNTNVRGEEIIGLTYHIQGELVPVLIIELGDYRKVYFEHHILLWKNPSLQIGLRPMAGVFKRMIAGMDIFMTQASGTGQIAFSRNNVGHVIALPLKPGQEIQVREHQFIAATDNIDYSFERVTGMGNMLFGNSGFFIDKFAAQNSEGLLWLHGFGNVFEVNLAAGEQLEVEPGGWFYKDATVTMEVSLQNLSTGLLSSNNFTMNRFTGPGRVGIQSMYQPPVSAPTATDSMTSTATQNNIATITTETGAVGIIAGIVSKLWRN